MVSIAGSKKLKRQMAPQFWGITRKDKRFVVTVRPGSHSKHSSIPSAVFLRDTIRTVSTLREAKTSIYSGKVIIDGVKRRSLHHGIGLMDTVELEGTGEIYRMVPGDGSILRPLKIESSEKTKKICKVTSRGTIKGGRMQLGLHDGRTIITEEKANVGDSCLIEVPNQKILDIIGLKKGALVMVIKGVNAGQIGTVIEVKAGTFVLPKMATIKLEKREVEIPTGIVIAIGQGKPVIQVIS